MWGQSAGAVSTDWYNYAYPKDPIVSGLVMDSGTTYLSITSEDPQHTNFTYLARSFGCTDADPTTQLNCLRLFNASSIMSFLKQHERGGATPLSFAPIVDNRTVFSDYPARTAARNFSQKPAIIGNNDNEGAAFGAYNKTYGPGQKLADGFTLGSFHCPASQTAHTRDAVNATTFRYYYAGNFSNISPQWWEGAYHSAELPLIFGTYGIVRGEGTAFEKQVSEKMQDYWLAFAEDSINGLPKLGWHSSQNGKGEGVWIGRENVVTQPISESRLDAPCNGTTPNGLPPPR